MDDRSNLRTTPDIRPAESPDQSPCACRCPEVSSSVPPYSLDPCALSRPWTHWPAWLVVRDQHAGRPVVDLVRVLDERMRYPDYRSWRHGGGGVPRVNPNLNGAGQKAVSASATRVTSGSWQGASLKPGYSGVASGRARSYIATCCTPSSVVCTPST